MCFPPCCRLSIKTQVSDNDLQDEGERCPLWVTSRHSHRKTSCPLAFYDRESGHRQSESVQSSSDVRFAPQSGYVQRKHQCPLHQSLNRDRGLNRWYLPTRRPLPSPRNIETPSRPKWIPWARRNHLTLPSLDWISNVDSSGSDTKSKVRARSNSGHWPPCSDVPDTFMNIELHRALISH